MVYLRPLIFRVGSIEIVPEVGVADTYFQPSIPPNLMLKALISSLVSGRSDRRACRVVIKILVCPPHLFWLRWVKLTASLYVVGSLGRISLGGVLGHGCICRRTLKSGGKVKSSSLGILAAGAGFCLVRNLQSLCEEGFSSPQFTHLHLRFAPFCAFSKQILLA